MIIECFGIPGAGKSTVTSLLVSEFGFKEVPKQVSKIYWIHFFSKYPFFVCRWCFSLLKESFLSRSFSLGRFKLAVFLNTIGRIHYADKHYSKEELVILDEGLVQRIFTLFESPKISKDYDTLIKKIPVKHLIIQIEYKGINFTESRVGTYRRTKGEEYIKKWRSVMAQNFISLSKSLLRSKVVNIRYIRDDGADTDLMKVVQDIKKFQTDII